MTKTELQVALAEATHTDKKTAAALLNALGLIAYKAVKKDGEFVLPGLGKLVKQKRPARMAFNPQTRQKVKVAAKTVVKFRIAKRSEGFRQANRHDFIHRGAMPFRRARLHSQSPAFGGLEGRTPGCRRRAVSSRQTGSGST